MTKQEMPLTGYAIERIYSNDLVLRHQVVPEGQGPEEGEMGFGWDWRLLDPERFEVRVTISIDPAGERDERVRATVVGRFRKVAERPTVGLPDFARLQAPAILLPYAREMISALTLHSIFGPFYLPPVNVAELMKDFDASEAIGAKQLAALAEGGEFNKVISSSSSSGKVRAKTGRKARVGKK